MTYKKFFEWIESGIDSRLNYSVIADKVHTENPSSCIMGTDTNGDPIGGFEYNAVYNDAYNALIVWKDKFIADGETFYEITELPIISASCTNGVFNLTHIVNKDVKRSYTNGVTEFNTMFKAMYYAMINLFVELYIDDVNYRALDANYSIINAFADASRSLEDYNSSTQDFFERAEYWNIRGHLYEFLADAEEGLYRKYKSKVDDLFSFIDDKQNEYNATPKKQAPSTSCVSSPDRIEASVETLWINNIAELNSKIALAFTAIQNDVISIHRELIGIVYMYLYYYNEISEWLSKGDMFISALQKTSTKPGMCLADTFAKLNNSGSFSAYSNGSMDVAYTLFKQAKQMRDSSKYKDNDEHNIYLRKYLTYLVVKKYKFFDNAVFLLNKIESLRTSMEF